MAYTYLDLTNEVLARFNEVTLTSSNFGSARGFQIQCKNAVNDSINNLNQREFNWPFNHNTHSETLVAGTTRYSIPVTAKTVDYATFRIKKDDALLTDGASLQTLDYKEYVDKYINQEDDATVKGSLPRYIIRNPNNNLLLYPYPDKAYTLKYEYYAFPVQLSDHSDVPGVPEAYRQVILDGATSYGYQFRGEVDQYQVNFDRFNTGINQMRTLLINPFYYVRSTALTRPTSTNNRIN